MCTHFVLLPSHTSEFFSNSQSFYFRALGKNSCLFSGGEKGNNSHPVPVDLVSWIILFLYSLIHLDRITFGYRPINSDFTYQFMRGSSLQLFWLFLPGGYFISSSPQLWISVVAKARKKLHTYLCPATGELQAEGTLGLAFWVVEMKGGELTLQCTVMCQLLKAKGKEKIITELPVSPRNSPS